jgi:hypothetical protein
LVEDLDLGTIDTSSVRGTYHLCHTSRRRIDTAGARMKAHWVAALVDLALKHMGFVDPDVTGSGRRHLEYHLYGAA